jgi:hypothetical protein
MIQLMATVFKATGEPLRGSELNEIPGNRDELTGEPLRGSELNEIPGNRDELIDYTAC